MELGWRGVPDLAVINDKGLAEDKAATEGDWDQAVGIAGQLRSLPQAEVASVREIEREGGDAHGVFPLTVHPGPAGL